MRFRTVRKHSREDALRNASNRGAWSNASRSAEVSGSYSLQRYSRYVTSYLRVLA